ncbi:MAG: hypothetical protein ACTSPM_03535 [Candidatus Heimdallarchaeota archaeon]
MTLQASDLFYYEGNKLSIIGIKGTGLCTPKDFEIETRSASTGCWRGYIMRYEIKDNQLFMEGFWVKTADGITPPVINDTAPLKITKEYNPGGLRGLGFRYYYKDVYLKQPFTGSLLLGNKPILEEYVHMGHPSPTSFQTVLKFDFEKGNIIKVEDISKEVEETRKQGDPKGYSPDSDSAEDIKKWIDKRFSLDLDF